MWPRICEHRARSVDDVNRRQWNWGSVDQLKIWTQILTVVMGGEGGITFSPLIKVENHLPSPPPLFSHFRFGHSHKGSYGRWKNPQEFSHKNTWQSQTELSSVCVAVMKLRMVPGYPLIHCKLIQVMSAAWKIGKLLNQHRLQWNHRLVSGLFNTIASLLHT